MLTFQDQLNLAELLALVVTKAGRLVGRLRVQKLMYLLQQKGAGPLQPAFFEYHHYGPFSAEIADVVKGAVRSKILKEHEDSEDDGWKRFEYQPDQHAKEYAERVDPATRATVEEVLAVCSDAHWRTLELAATADFLRRADNLDREVAFQEALERKPQCARFEPEAKQLLQALSL